MQSEPRTEITDCRRDCQGHAAVIEGTEAVTRDGRRYAVEPTDVFSHTIFGLRDTYTNGKHEFVVLSVDELSAIERFEKSCAV